MVKLSTYCIYREGTCVVWGYSSTNYNLGTRLGRLFSFKFRSLCLRIKVSYPYLQEIEPRFLGRLAHNLATIPNAVPRLHPSMYGATAPSGPWPPSKVASIRSCFQLFFSILVFLLFLAAVVRPSEPHPPIWLLVFPLVFCCRRSHLEPFLGSFICHSYYVTRPS